MPWFSRFAEERSNRLSFGRKAKTLYAITEGFGLPVKLGITEDVYTRIQTIMAQTWRPLFVCWTVKGCLPVHEAALKHLLTERRQWGEWYLDEDDRLKRLLGQTATRDGVEAAIERMAADMGDQPVRHPRRERDKPRPQPFLEHPDGFPTAAR